jgi:hypothetical protein
MGQIPDADATTFRIAIRVKATWSNAAFSDTDTVWQRVAAIFTKLAQGKGSIFKTATATFVAAPIAAATLKPCELAVYVLDSYRNSIIKPKYGLAVSASDTGNTYVGGALNLSEVYLKHDYHDTAETLANTIVHELMHNKLNMGNDMHDLAMFVGDAGGFMQEQLPHNTSLDPSSRDVSTLAPALSRNVAQQIGV